MDVLSNVSSFADIHHARIPYQAIWRTTTQSIFCYTIFDPVYIYKMLSKYEARNF